MFGLRCVVEQEEEDRPKSKMNNKILCAKVSVHPVIRCDSIAQTNDVITSRLIFVNFFSTWDDLRYSLWPLESAAIHSLEWKSEAKKITTFRSVCFLLMKWLIKCRSFVFNSSEFTHRHTLPKTRRPEYTVRWARTLSTSLRSPVASLSNWN